MSENELHEQVLDDAQLVFTDFFYLVDNKPMRSPITGTVEMLKKRLSAKKIKRCDVIGRGLHNGMM